MEFWMLVWIFYVVLVAIMFVYVGYFVIKINSKEHYNGPVMVTAMVATIVLLSVFWPVTLLTLPFTKSKKDREEGDKDEDY